MIARIALVLSTLCCPLHATNVPHGAELVFPEVFDVRDELGTRVLRVNDKITLNLKRSSVLHEEFMVRSYEYGVPRHTYFDVDALEEDLFHDGKHLASVILSEDDGSLKVVGVVGPNLKIKPIEGMERGEHGHIPHSLEVISKEEPKIQTVFGEHIPERNVTLMERSRRKNPYDVKKIYVELRVLADSAFRAGFRRVLDLVRYVMIEMNCINLRYLTVANPMVQIKLRAIELTDRGQESKYYKYLTYNSIDGLDSLYKLVDYVGKHNRSYGRYDIVFCITGLDMVAVQGSVQESNLQGFAFVGGVCTAMRVGLGEDKAHSYIGIRIIAHELGHTLGCSHDGSTIDGQFKNYRADSSWCPWEDGYLMSYIEDSIRSVKFSRCCDYSISLVAWSTEIDCLHKISTGTRLKKHKTRTLPGHFLGRNQQCRMTYPTLLYTRYMGRRNRFTCMGQCFVPGAQFQASNSTWDMLLIDGTICERERVQNRLLLKVCINGECVPKKRRYPVKTVGK